MVQIISLNDFTSNPSLKDLKVYVGKYDIDRETIHFAYVPTNDDSPYPFYVSQINLKEAIWDLVRENFGNVSEKEWRLLETELEM